jgi:hypothetical protein
MEPLFSLGSSATQFAIPLPTHPSWQQHQPIRLANNHFILRPVAKSSQTLPSKRKTLLFLIGDAIFIIVLVTVCTWIYELRRGLLLARSSPIATKKVYATKLKLLQQTNVSKRTARQSDMAASPKIHCWQHSVLDLSAV